MYMGRIRAKRGNICVQMRVCEREGEARFDDRFAAKCGHSTERKKWRRFHRKMRKTKEAIS